jgi:hypothetical protein
MTCPSLGTVDRWPQIESLQVPCQPKDSLDCGLYLIRFVEVLLEKPFRLERLVGSILTKHLFIFANWIIIIY